MISDSSPRGLSNMAAPSAATPWTLGFGLVDSIFSRMGRDLGSPVATRAMQTGISLGLLMWYFSIERFTASISLAKVGTVSPSGVLERMRGVTLRNHAEDSSVHSWEREGAMSCQTLRA